MSKNILHIWSVGGSSSVSLKAVKALGYNGDVVMRRDQDPYHFTEWYDDIVLDISGGDYMTLVNKMARNYDIIHSHGIYDNLEEIKQRYPDKKIVIHYHGSDLLNCQDEEFRLKQESFADCVLVSTEDMIPHVEYVKDKPCHFVPNPIDQDLYKWIDNPERRDLSVFFDMSYLETELVEEWIKERHDWEYVVRDREEHPIPFSQIPEFYSNFTRYIDVKIVKRVKSGNEPGKALSKSGLEALACGLEVLNWDNKILKGLPEQHTMAAHAEQMDKIYKGLWK
jgi:hypothetical protein